MSLIPQLSGRSVIVLEPDPFIAAYIRAALIGSGAEVFVPARDLDLCAAWLDDIAIHAAVLNVDDPSYNPVSFAALFRQRGIAMLFVSAAATRFAAEHGTPHLRKPFASFEVVEAIAALLSAGFGVERQTANPCPPVGD